MASRNIRRQAKKLARLLNVLGGFILVCTDCEFQSDRVRAEGWVRTVAINHCVSTGHTVRVLELK